MDIETITVTGPNRASRPAHHAATTPVALV